MKQKSYSRYRSKVKRVNIPLPSFEYVHKPWFTKRLGKTSPGFLIGRDHIIEKLKAWLTKEKTDGGSYMITGYRGMGKTSFVDRVLYELVGEADLWVNLIGWALFVLYACSIWFWTDHKVWCSCGIAAALAGLLITCKFYLIKEYVKKSKFRLKTAWFRIRRNGDGMGLWKRWTIIQEAWRSLTPKEWDRVNNMLYGANVKEKKYSHISVSVNLGQEILDERSILCVLTSQLNRKYLAYITSPVANAEMWLLYVGVATAALMWMTDEKSLKDTLFKSQWIRDNWIPIATSVMAMLTVMSHQLRTWGMLRMLSRRIDAELKKEDGLRIAYQKMELRSGTTYSYPVADTRGIESKLIDILDIIERFPVHPKFYFVFDELDKIETPSKEVKSAIEYSGEKYHPGGGTSRKRQTAVLHLLANLKFFTSTAKAKFIFIAGREMYDGYLADMTDRESAISSLFNGVIYVDSFCKNEKSEKDVMYNAETFVSRQLLPQSYIERRIMENYIECKMNGVQYVNIDINLKMYFEYLTVVYSKAYLMGGSMREAAQRRRAFDDARDAIDKVVGLLYHYAVYLYHVSNGSPKKMRLVFENHIRPIKDKNEFLLSKGSWLNPPLEGDDLDIHVSEKCCQLLSFGEKEQRVIGFIHFISFPVNQIMTDANQFGDKLLVSASFLIDHIYKYHTGGFSWRNIEQTPELLEVYKIPEFRGFISSILNYLTQTHIIKITCGLYQYKFRKQIAEEISLASKVSEEVSAIFNFMRDESQSVKDHYAMRRNAHVDMLREEEMDSVFSTAGQHHIMGDLYMADEDYNNAIVEYQTAVCVLDKRKADNNGMVDASLMFAYLRNYMKLGMAYEKRRTFAPAYNMYNEAIGLLMQYGEITGDRNQLLSQMVNQSENIHKLELLENTQMTYPAILAKLFVNEKIDLGGITIVDIETALTEFRIIYKHSTQSEKFFLETDFYKRLGDILFYKNGLVGFDLSEVNTPEKIESFALDCNKCKCKRIEEWENNRTVPCYACHYYHKSLEVIVRKLFNDLPLKNPCVNSEITEPLVIKDMKCEPLSLLRLIVGGGSAKSMRQNYMIQMAEILDCMGNIMLSCAGSSKASEEDEIRGEFLSRFLHDVHEMNVNLDKIKDERDYRLLDKNYREKIMPNKMESAILYFWEASLTFKYGRDPKKASDSMKKILRVIQNYLRVADRKETYCKKEEYEEWKARSGMRKVVIGEFLNEIKNRLIKHCLICLYEHYNFINIVEIQRLKWIFYSQMYEHISLNRLTLFPDVEEILLIYYEMMKLCIVRKVDVKQTDLDEARKYIKLYSRDINNVNKNESAQTEDDRYSWEEIEKRNIDFTVRLAGIYNNITLGPLRHDSTSYEKILSLRFKTVMNKMILYTAFPDMKTELFSHNKTSLQSIKFVECFNKYLKPGKIYCSEGVGWKQFFPKLFDEEEMRYETLEDRMLVLEFLIRDSIYCLTNILENITPYTSTTLFTHSFMGTIYKDLNEWNVLFDSLFNYYKVFDKEMGWQAYDKKEYLDLEEEWQKYDRARCADRCPLDKCKYRNEIIQQSRQGGDDKRLSEEDSQMIWKSNCPYYYLDRCKNKPNYFDTTRMNVDGDIDSLGREYRRIFRCRNNSDRLFADLLHAINKPNIQFLMTTYSEEMALKTFRQAQEVHREGKSYKDMIYRMYYLDDDLKNDTIQFDLALERFRINCGFIDDYIDTILKYVTNSVHEVEAYATDNQTRSSLHQRFVNLFWNVKDENCSE